MPNRPPHTCSTAGCPNLASQGPRCEPCTTRYNAERDARRGSTTERGYGAEHQRLAAQVRIEEPICRLCRIRATTQIDHIKPLRFGGETSRKNMQGLCDLCHGGKRLDEHYFYGTNEGPPPRGILASTDDGGRGGSNLCPSSLDPRESPPEALSKNGKSGKPAIGVPGTVSDGDVHEDRFAGVDLSDGRKDVTVRYTVDTETGAIDELHEHESRELFDAIASREVLRGR